MKNKNWFILVILLYSCTGQSKIECNKQYYPYSVSIGHNHKTTMDYQVDKELIDISETLGIEKWGPDIVKRYANDSDTLTLAWYYANGAFTDSDATTVINKTSENQLGFIHERSYKSQSYNELKGMSMNGICDKYSIIIYCGINNSSDKILVVVYKTKLDSDNAQMKLTCTLNSMSFKQL